MCVPAFALLLLLCGCTNPPRALVDAPMPGIIGKPRFSTGDNSTTERVSFLTRVAKPEICRTFQSYCRRLGLKKDLRAGTTGVDWWLSEHEALGILVSPNEGAGTSWVTYFYSN